MTPTDVRVRRPLFVPSRSCVCVSVGMCFERTLHPTSTPSPRRLCVCKWRLLCRSMAMGPSSSSRSRPASARSRTARWQGTARRSASTGPP